MICISRKLLPALGLLLPLQSVVVGQAIVRDGQLSPVDEATLGPAAEVLSGSWASGAAASLQLTDAVLQNLTNLDLSIDVSLFRFPENGTEQAKFPACKTYPGDELWPSASIWNAFDRLTGGALIKTVPIGAVCYPNHESYDPVKCQNVIDNWHDSEVHVRDPTSVMSPLFQGETCMPQNGNSSTCEIGGFPQYVVNVTNVAQIQLAVNLARNTNMRLVVHNTGHDFIGKSVGAGALSIWTHHLKSTEFVEELKTPSYTGPALQVGAGIQIHDLYEVTKELGYTAVAGECKGVGVAGGYIAGGGHSPLMSLYGMGADSVLSVDVVLPDGRFVTADETQNPDLFWALRGGGGGTFGVVTGMTLKLHPAMSFSGVTFDLASGPGTENPDNEVFWAAVYAYWRQFPAYAGQRTYGFSTVFPTATGGFTWSMRPWLVPGLPLADFRAMVAPLFDEWAALGLHFTPHYFEHDNWYDTWKAHFPTENVAVARVRTASRLFPRKNWDDAALLNATLDAVRGIIEEGSALVQYNIRGAAPAGTPASAVNPAWREAVMFGIVGYNWSEGATRAELAAVHRRISRDWMGRLRRVTPGGGGYLNEGDAMEPDPGQAFFGAHYARLLDIKRRVDPGDVFWAQTAVGSERWYVTRQEDWLTLQTGRLCRK